MKGLGTAGWGIEREGKPIVSVNYKPDDSRHLKILSKGLPETAAIKAIGKLCNDKLARARVIMQALAKRGYLSEFDVNNILEGLKEDKRRIQ